MPADLPLAVDLGRPRRVHVIGVGGAGMSAIASVLAAMGHQVTGSDLKPSATTERLTTEGVAVSLGHAADQVGQAELVTYSPAVGPGNPELVEAARRGVQVASRAEVLAAIAGLRRLVAVAGTHGKTTTASMLSLVLTEADLRPSFLIGADVNEIGTNALWDDGEWLVLEADESFGTFRTLRPEVAVVTNVEPDHLDHYGTVAALEEAFAAFAAGATGSRVLWGNDPAVATLAERLGDDGRTVLVGTSASADYRLETVSAGRSASVLRLHGPAGLLGELRLAVPGAHNAANAAMAVAAALEAGAPFGAAERALARFAGVPRRFEFRGEARGVTFVDDYAHLPSEVRAVLAAARAGDWGRIVAVFQPHRYTRTAALAGQFADAFDDADVVFVTDVYGAGEPVLPGVSGRLVADAVTAHDPGRPAQYRPGRSELRASVAAELRPGDLCLTLGAGDLTSLPDELLAAPQW